MTMRLAHLPPGVPFLDELARRWLAANGSGEGLILLPTRRAARALADAFLHVADGRPLLLPRITALGAVDEVGLSLAGSLDLPPAVPEAERCAVLARLVIARAEAQGDRLPADRAWALARELAGLMDEAEQAEIPLAAVLAGAVPEELAAHWQVTLRFLSIVTEAWPAWLAEAGLANPAARQAALLRTQARVWQDTPPATPVWAAGFAGAPPAAAALLRTIADLPMGLVVLPWLDPVEDGDETHAQSGLASLLAAINARPADAAAWGELPPRARLLGIALRPASGLGTWREPPPADDGLLRLTPADQQEEAVAIAALLREAVVTGSAALVTPDRALAVRVSAELLRWGIVADDSAGETLAHTPPAVFLRLLAEVVESDLAPVRLLALLKHPLCAAGLPPAACREAARAVELVALRGARPSGGFTGLRRAGADPDFVERVRICLEPLLRRVPPVEYAPAELLADLIRAAEALAATDEVSGERLWAGEEGEALAEVLAEALAALPVLPPQPTGVLPGLLEALLEGAVVRTRRVLRGRDGVEHPRVAIWGLLEARLQAVDTVVLGGLAEGVWPEATDPGPWLSRPMRWAAGLPCDARIGQSAHDFVLAACCAPVAVLSCPVRRDGAPAVPSRWLARLEALLAGHGRQLPPHPATAWARALDLPRQRRQIAAPHPAPPVSLRPRRLRVTEIGTLIADPYAIYARHVLEILPLDPLEQATDTLDFGILVHGAIATVQTRFGRAWPDQAGELLREALDKALVAHRIRPALAAWWRPRLVRIAAWFDTEERRRRAEASPAVLASERPGEWVLDVAGAPFRLTGRADRIERAADGYLTILDYKTGTVPAPNKVADGTEPQLPLEAAMAEAGGFGADVAGPVAHLHYWHLTGSRVAGKVETAVKDAIGVGDLARGRVLALLESFAAPSRSYPHCPHPGRGSRFASYAQLARASELAGAEEEE